MRFTLIIFFLILFSMPVFSNDENEKKVLFSLCQLQLSEDVKRGNNTFTDIYYFEVDEQGSPKNIREKFVKFTKIEEVKNCLVGWKFSGFLQNSAFRVEFTWKHGSGWNQVRIVNKSFSQTIINGKKDCSSLE